MGRKLLETKCYHCQKTFKFKKGLETHLKDAHHLGTANAKAKKTWCQICGTSYSTEAQLADHLDSHKDLLLQRSQLHKTPAVSEFSGCKNVLKGKSEDAKKKEGAEKQQ